MNKEAIRAAVLGKLEPAEQEYAQGMNWEWVYSQFGRGVPVSAIAHEIKDQVKRLG